MKPALPLSASLLALTLSAPAEAHRPHTVVVALAMDSDADEGLLVMDPHDISGILTTSDGGAHWDFLGGEPQDDELIAGGATEGLVVLLAEDGGLWTSGDFGLTWREQQVPMAGSAAVDLALSGPYFAVASDDGVCVGNVTHADEAVCALEGVGLSAVAFASDSSRVVLAGTRDGDLYRSSDRGESFSALKPTPGERRIWALAEREGAVYAGTDSQAIRLDLESASWSACETLPKETPGTHASDVPVLRFNSEGLLLATSGEEAMFVSDDGCTSWTLHQVGYDVEYGGIGNASSADEGFTALSLEGETGFVGGFMGLAQSTDGAASWSHPKLLPEDYFRGVAIPEDYPANPRLVRGGYGGGVAWTDDGGASWSGSAVGLKAGYTYDVSVSPDFSVSGVMYYVGSNVPYRSTDFGATWAELDPPMARARRFRTFGPRLYVLGEDERTGGGVDGQVALSLDNGDTWHEWESFYDLSGGAAPRDVIEGTLDGEEALMVLVDQPAGLYLTQDRGSTWRQVYRGENEPSAGAALWPPDAGTRLLFLAASTGVVYSDDGGRTWETATTPPEGSLREFAEADDGTLFAITRAGQVYRSEDGGDVWDPVGDPLVPAVFTFQAAPDFASNGTLVAGTQRGIWYSTDRGESFHQLPRYERFEAGSYHLSCEGGAIDRHSGHSACEAYEDASHGLGGGDRLYAGDRESFTFNGHAFRLVTPSTEGLFEVLVNGDAAGVLDLSAGEDGLSDLGSGWKDVTLTLVQGPDAGLELDLIEAWGDGEILGEDPDTGDTGVADDTGGEEGGVGGDGGDGGDTGAPKDKGCGCGVAGGGGAAGLLIAAALGAALRRRGPRTATQER